MLVLSRQKDEGIIVDFSDLSVAEFEALKKKGNAKVKITVVDVRGDKVRLGGEAPLRKIIIDRVEVFEKRQKDRQAS